VLHEHRTTPDHRRGNRILVRTHIHHLTPFGAEHIEDIGAARSGGAAVLVQFPAQTLVCPSCPPVFGSAAQESTKTVALGDGSEPQVNTATV
jgi:hypothetical protein